MPEPGRLLLLIVSVAASQIAIAALNDYCDRDLDAVSKPWRPIPSRLVSPRGALLATAVALVTCLVATLPLGSAALLWVAVGTAGGLAYDLVLKRTVWSWLPFVVSFPALPLYSWAAMQRLDTSLLWVYPVGAPLVLGIHLADSLPDVADDQQLGVRGLAHRLGAIHSARLCWACFLASPLVMALSALALPLHPAVLATAALGGMLLTGLAAALARRGLGFGRSSFRLCAVAAVVYSGGWLGALVAGEL